VQMNLLPKITHEIHILKNRLSYYMYMEVVSENFMTCLVSKNESRKNLQKIL